MSEAAKKEAPASKADLQVPPPPEESKKSKGDLLTVIILALVCVNVGVVVSMGLFMKKLSSRVKDLQNRTIKLAETVQEPPQEKDKPLGKELAPEMAGTPYPMDSFLVNISSDEGPKFLQAQLELEMSDPSLEDEITRKKAALRDSIIVLLSSRTYKDLRQPDGLNKLRKDMVHTLNSQLTTGKVKSIYFTQFHFN